jgi:hypothetical protein
MTIFRHPAMVLAAALSAAWILIGVLVYVALTRA